MSAGQSPTLIPGIAEAICARILRGGLKGGEVIPQRELAKELGVSPVPLREALRRLEAEGLVTFLPYRGTIVTPLTEAEIWEAFAAGIAVGLVMVPEAVRRLKRADLEALGSLARLLDGGDAAIEDVLEFYTILLRPAGMPLLLDMIRKIIMRTVRFFPMTQANRIALQHARPTRMDMVEAFRSGDIEAAKQSVADYHRVRCEGLVRAFRQEQA